MCGQKVGSSQASMGCSQTLSQQNAAMKAALVTLQKKMKGYDAQIAELAQEKDRLHRKVEFEFAILLLHTFLA